MDCVMNLSSFRSYALPLQGFKCNSRKRFSCSISIVGGMNSNDILRSMTIKAVSGSTSSAKSSSSESEEEKSETPEDVDKLRKIGVKTIFCLQQDPDLEYFGVDIGAIQDYAKKCGDIEHIRTQIRDFDSFDLRIRLPAVVSKLYKAINRNGGVTYIHCTAGLGRAPAVAMAYMFWVQGYKLSEAHNLLLSKRSCFPKLDAIKSATADILTDLKKELVTLTWEDSKCSTVEVSGLDIGWGQRMPLKFDKELGSWTVQRKLPEGRYEYKYIVDGEWTYNEFELVTTPNKDGHVNNFLHVVNNDPSSANAAVRKRLTSEDPDVTKEERLKIRQFLESYTDEE